MQKYIGSCSTISNSLGKFGMVVVVIMYHLTNPQCVFGKQISAISFIYTVLNNCLTFGKSSLAYSVTKMLISGLLDSIQIDETKRGGVTLVPALHFSKPPGWTRRTCLTGSICSEMRPRLPRVAQVEAVLPAWPHWQRRRPKLSQSVRLLVRQRRRRQPRPQPPPTAAREVRPAVAEAAQSAHSR